METESEGGKNLLALIKGTARLRLYRPLADLKSFATRVLGTYLVHNVVFSKYSAIVLLLPVRLEQWHTGDNDRLRTALDCIVYHISLVYGE